MLIARYTEGYRVKPAKGKGARGKCGGTQMRNCRCCARCSCTDTPDFPSDDAWHLPSGTKQGRPGLGIRGTYQRLLVMEICGACENSAPRGAHVVLLFHAVRVVNCTDSFLKVKPISWDKTPLGQKLLLFLYIAGFSVLIFVQIFVSVSKPASYCLHLCLESAPSRKPRDRKACLICHPSFRYPSSVLPILQYLQTGY